MTDEDGVTPETSGEEANKEANVTVDEPTAAAHDESMEPNTEWEEKAAEQGEDPEAGQSDGSQGTGPTSS